MAATLNILFRFEDDDKTLYLNESKRDIVEPGIWKGCLTFPTPTPSLRVRIGDPALGDPATHRGVIQAQDGSRIEVLGTITDDDSFAELLHTPGDPVYPRYDLVVVKYHHEAVTPPPTPLFKVITGSLVG